MTTISIEYAASAKDSVKPARESSLELKLPPELIERCLSFLSPQDWASTSTVSKNWNQRTMASACFAFSDSVKPSKLFALTLPRKTRSSASAIGNKFPKASYLLTQKALEGELSKTQNTAVLEIRQLIESFFEQIFSPTGALPENLLSLKNAIHVLEDRIVAALKSLPNSEIVYITQKELERSFTRKAPCYLKNAFDLAQFYKILDFIVLNHNIPEDQRNKIEDLFGKLIDNNEIARATELYELGNKLKGNPPETHSKMFHELTYHYLYSNIDRAIKLALLIDDIDLKNDAIVSVIRHLRTGFSEEMTLKAIKLSSKITNRPTTDYILEEEFAQSAAGAAETEQNFFFENDSEESSIVPRSCNLLDRFRAMVMSTLAFRS